MIKVTFLGTGQAVPTAKRNHTAMLLQYKNENILIDCGEGTQRQFRFAKLNPCKLTCILITHWHGDHILGLPGLLQTLVLNGYNKTLQIYGPKRTEMFVKLLKKLFVFEGKIKVKVKEVSKGKVLDTEDFYIETLPMKHGTFCNAYSFVEKNKRRINKQKLKKYKIPNSPLIKKLQQGKNITYNGKKIKASELTYIEKGRKITFIFDTGLNKNINKIVKDSDILIIESTYLDKEKQRAKEYKHLTAKQAAQIAKKSKVKKLILSHISQRYEKDEKRILNEAKKTFKNTSLAQDFMKLEM